MTVLLQQSATSWQALGMPSDPRQRRSILLLGKLIGTHGDYLCRVRNLSIEGMVVECDSHLAADEWVRVELRNMKVLEGVVVWTEAGRAGIRLDEAADVDAMLHGSIAAPGQSPRAPRLSAACPAQIQHLGRVTRHHLRDLSQTGCRIELTTPLPIGSEVVIGVPGLEPRHAMLRWNYAGEAGFAFHETLSFATLTEWQGKRYSRFSERAGNPVAGG